MDAYGSFEAMTSDGNAAIVVARYPGAGPAPVTDAAFMGALVRKFGAPVDPIVVRAAIIHGHVTGVADTVLATKDHVELQCEARAIATKRGLIYLVSLVALGPPVWAPRLQHAAWQIEDMQRVLNSMTML